MNVPPLRKILLVEDELDIRTVAVAALAGIPGCEVESCSSGFEALGRARRASPDLILLDVMMPGMDGPATLAALRQIDETKHTPVVFMTARVQQRDIDEYKAIGAIDVVAKPFDPLALARKIEDVWRRCHA